MTHFLGLDIAKDSFMALVLDEHERVLRPATAFPNAPAGFVQLLDWLPDPAQTVALCEPTGVYGQRLKQALADALQSLHEVNAQSVRRFSFSQVQTKTDQADALALAEAARTLFLSKPHILQRSRVVSDPQRENLALWLSEYNRLRVAIATLRQQLKTLAYQVAADAALLRERRQQELRFLLQRQREVQRQIERLVSERSDRQAELVRSIPGIGPLTTAAAVIVVRDVRRFASADALKAYLGIYPRRRQSGPREGAAHLAHHGNALMRHMLWNAAKAAVRTKHTHNPFRDLFERMRAKGKSATAAYAAVARKLVQVIYGVLKNQSPYKFLPTST